MPLDPNNIIVLPAVETFSDDLSNPSLKSEPDSLLPKSQAILPSKVLELYKDANNVQKLMDNRQKNISKVIKESNG